MELNKYGFSKFDGQKDFTFWKAKVSNHLMFIGLDHCLTNDIVKKETDDCPIDTIKHKKALAFVLESLSDELFRQYIHHTSSKELWKELCNNFGKLDAQQLYFVKRDFESCVKSPKETMENFISKLRVLKSKLLESGHTVDGPGFALTIIGGTHKEFGSYISAVTAKDDTTALDPEVLIKLLVKEDKLRRTCHNSPSLSCSVNDDGERKVFSVRGDGESEDDVERKVYSVSDKNKNLSKRRCYSCSKTGHYANKCPRGPRSTVKVRNSTNNEFHACILNRVNGLSNTVVDNGWILDSGASTHVCNNSSWFSKIEYSKSSVIVGDGRSVEIVGRGTIRLAIKAYNKTNILVLKNVALAPILLSMSFLLPN